jgi:porin
MRIDRILHAPLWVAGFLLSQPALAEVETHRHQDLPKHEVGDSALTFEAGYTADIWRNEGGVSEGTRYLHNVDLIAQLDLGRAIGWNGATAQAYVLYNNSSALSELTGDAQVVSNIETGVEALRLYEFWVDAPLWHGASLKVGLYDLNSEFDALETSSLFMGSAHGIGTDISQSGDNGPSIFPVTSLSARLQVELDDTVTLRGAVLDGVPGDPSRPGRTAVKLGNGDGALLIGEVDVGNEKARLVAGAWGYTKRFVSHDLSGEGTSNGFYLRGEARLAETAAGPVHGFFRLGVASGQVNPFSRFASAGLTVKNGAGNTFGLAVAHAALSDQFKEANPGLGSGETVFEATYAHRLTDWLEVQPNAQWVLNPSADPLLGEAFAFGLRFNFAF